MEHGHPEAWFYPIGMVYVECAIVKERVANRVASDTILMQAAMSALLNKKGHKAFKEVLAKYQSS